MESQMRHIQETLVDYERCDVYNMDETGLYQRRAPDYKLTQAGTKKSNAITACMCGNADGSEKVPIWLTGKAPNPRAFKNISEASLGCIWRANSTAWNNTSLIKEWLGLFKRRIRNRGRRVVLYWAISVPINAQWTSWMKRTMDST